MNETVECIHLYQWQTHTNNICIVEVKGNQYLKIAMNKLQVYPNLSKDSTCKDHFPLKMLVKTYIIKRRKKIITATMFFGRNKNQSSSDVLRQKKSLK